MGTKELPLNGTLWQWQGAPHQFLPNRSDFERALRPAGYAGARLRLRKFMLKLVAGEAVGVSVLGGSMTRGDFIDARPWPLAFEEYARSLGHNLTVHNLAKPSTGSEYAVTHVLFERPELRSSGLIIVDTSINDWYDWFRGFDRSTGGSMDSYDLLVQELIGLPHRPAVIELGTVHMHGPGHGLRNHFVSCSASLSDFPHARAEAFQLPIVSFPDAMCHCCGPQGLWFGNMHPAGLTHDAIARTLLAGFGLEMEDACKADGLDVSDHPPPPRNLQEAPFSQCLRLHTKTTVDFTAYESAEEGLPFVGERGGWQFARDLPTKPFGWLLPPGSPPGETLGLKVNASDGGWIRLDYLSTYENIGSITCWVDGIGTEQGCFVDALQDAEFSVVRSAYIGLPGGLGTQLLQCRSNGGKFKVMGIASC